MTKRIACRISTEEGIALRFGLSYGLNLMLKKNGFLHLKAPEKGNLVHNLKISDEEYSAIKILMTRYSASAISIIRFASSLVQLELKNGGNKVLIQFFKLTDPIV